MQPTITIEEWQLAQRLLSELQPVDAELERRPPVARTPGERDRVRGAVLGAAIGDAMGHPTEFLRSREEIERRYGAGGVSGFVLYWEENGNRFAPYTDDTQLAEVVLRTAIWARDQGATLDEAMQAMAKRMIAWAYAPQGGHRAPGQATLSGCRRLANGVAWEQAGELEAKGCGSVMRAYPMGIVWQGDSDRATRWAVEQSKLTHRAPAALAASAAMAAGIQSALNRATLAEMVQRMVVAATPLDRDTADLLGTAWRDGAAGISPDVVLERLQGWTADEAIAAAVYVLARHPDDYRGAVLEAANAPGDSDSIGTLVGALIGGRVGASHLPPEWVRDLERAPVLERLADRA